MDTLTKILQALERFDQVAQSYGGHQWRARERADTELAKQVYTMTKTRLRNLIAEAVVQEPTFIYVFTMRGFTNFPIEMLRVDDCGPLASTDSDAMRKSIRGENMGFTIDLVTRGRGPTWEPNRVRWSFEGWSVIALDRREEV